MNLISSTLRLKLVAARLAVGFLLACGIAAAEAQSLTNTIATLQAQVNALPGTNNVQLLKKAVLNLALEQASNCVVVSYLTDASNRVADVQGALAADPDSMATLNPAATNIGSLVPPFVTNGNPYLNVMHAGLATTLVSTDSLWGKSTTSNAVLTSTAGVYYTRDVGEIMEAYLFQFVNPASTNRGRPEIATRFLRRAHAYADTIDVQDAQLGGSAFFYDDFAIGPALCALREFAWLYPGLLLPSQKAMWDRAMNKAAVSLWPKINTDPSRGRYANIDIAGAYEALNFGLYLTNQTYLDRARWLIDARTNDLYADGAWAYIWSQNESRGYHITDVDHLARYWLVSGYALCTNLIQRSGWYSPVSSPVLGEFWTSPSWKQLWNSALPDTGGEQAAAFSGNPYVRWQQDQYFLAAAVANPADWQSRRWDATFYRTNIAALAPLTNSTLFDANIFGPRAQLGRFSYAATGRRIIETEPGHTTLMGAGIVQSNANLWNALVMGVYPRVRANLSTNTPTTDPNNTGWIRDWAWLTTKMTNDHTVGRDFSALSATYRLHRYGSSTKGAEVNWRGRQMWLGLSDRIIGWLSVVPDGVSATAYEVDGVVRLGTGGTVASTTKTNLNLGGGTNFAYGDLRLTIHNHNYGSVTSAIVPFRLAQYPTTELTFSDSLSLASGGTNLLTYTTNNEYHFVVEIRPGTTPTAAIVTRQIATNGLRTLTATVPDATYMLLFNPGNAPLNYSNAIPCAHPNAAWFTGWQTQARQMTLLPVSAGQATLNATIPARGQILFVNTAEAARLQLVATNGTAFFTAPAPRPLMKGASVGGPNLNLTGNGGTAGGIYYVLGATNIAAPPAGWTTVATNQFDAEGAFNFAVPVNLTTPAQFFRMRLP
jgi:hypothetical protein